MPGDETVANKQGQTVTKKEVVTPEQLENERITNIVERAVYNLGPEGARATLCQLFGVLEGNSLVEDIKQNQQDVWGRSALRVSNRSNRKDGI